MDSNIGSTVRVNRSAFRVIRLGESQGELTSFHSFGDDFKFSHRRVVIIAVGLVPGRRFVELAVDAWPRFGAGDGMEGYRGIFDLKAAPSGRDEHQDAGNG